MRKEDAKVWQPKPLESYSDAEKIAKFDELYTQVRRNLEFLQKEGYEVKDVEHFDHEALVDLLGPDIWQVYNALLC